MSNQQRHTFWWWVKTTAQVLGTTGVAFAPEILQLFPEHTMLFKLAIPIGFAVKLFGMKWDYERKSERLPEGVRKTMDKISDDYTGVKDSKNADYIGTK